MKKRQRNKLIKERIRLINKTLGTEYAYKKLMLVARKVNETKIKDGKDERSN